MNLIIFFELLKEMFYQISHFIQSTLIPIHIKSNLPLFAPVKILALTFIQLTFKNKHFLQTPLPVVVFILRKNSNKNPFIYL